MKDANQPILMPVPAPGVRDFSGATKFAPLASRKASLPQPPAGRTLTRRNSQAAVSVRTLGRHSELSTPEAVSILGTSETVGELFCDKRTAPHRPALEHALFLGAMTAPLLICASRPDNGWHADCFARSHHVIETVNTNINISY